MKSLKMTNERLEKLTKILFLVLVMIVSFTVLTHKIPESRLVQQTIGHLEDSHDTVMKFSGTTIATSVALSALPDDFASPLAGTVADLNMYLIFMFAVLVVEKLIVIEGIKYALVFMIPGACLLYIIWIMCKKEMFKKFANKLLILGMSLIVVIPFGTHFAQTVCDDYLTYVNETIEEANAGAEKINTIMASEDEDATIFEKLSDAFKTAVQDVTDLLAYFKNVVRKCVNSIAIMLVTTFVVPLLILFLFRWLLNELFALHFPMPSIRVQIPEEKQVKAEEDEKYEKEIT